jgi:hypothetical protein
MSTHGQRLQRLRERTKSAKLDDMIDAAARKLECFRPPIGIGARIDRSVGAARVQPHQLVIRGGYVDPSTTSQRRHVFTTSERTDWGLPISMSFRSTATASALFLYRNAYRCRYPNVGKLRSMELSAIKNIVAWQDGYAVSCRQ